MTHLLSEASRQDVGPQTILLIY